MIKTKISFKLKIREHKSGQAVVEYFILFTVIAVLTVLSLSSFLTQVQTIMQGNETEEGYFERTVERIK